MKIKITDFYFALKILLLSSLILIGKFGNKTDLQINTLKITTNSIPDTIRFRPLYQQLILKEIAYKTKN